MLKVTAISPHHPTSSPAEDNLYNQTFAYYMLNPEESLTVQTGDRVFTVGPCSITQV